MEKTNFDSSTSNSDILQMPYDEMLKFVQSHANIYIPLTLETEEDMQDAQIAMGKCMSYHAWLVNLESEAYVMKRIAQKNGQDKEDMITREKVFHDFADLMLKQYNAVSRMFSIREMISQELKMSDSRCVRQSDR